MTCLEKLIDYLSDMDYHVQSSMNYAIHSGKRIDTMEVERLLGKHELLTDIAFRAEELLAEERKQSSNPSD